MSWNASLSARRTLIGAASSLPFLSTHTRFICMLLVSCVVHVASAKQVLVLIIFFFIHIVILQLIKDAFVQPIQFTLPGLRIQYLREILFLVHLETYIPVLLLFANCHSLPFLFLITVFPLASMCALNLGCVVCWSVHESIFYLSWAFVFGCVVCLLQLSSPFYAILLGGRIILTVSWSKLCWWWSTVSRLSFLRNCFGLAHYNFFTLSTLDIQLPVKSICTKHRALT